MQPTLVNRGLPAWAARTGLAVGAPAAASAVLTCATAVAAPLFAQPQDVPSVAEPAPASVGASGRPVDVHARPGLLRPSDGVLLHAFRGGSVDGQLAGGTVMSLVTLRDSGIVVVMSNIAPANTPALAQRIGGAFADQAR